MDKYVIKYSVKIYICDNKPVRSSLTCFQSHNDMMLSLSS